MGNYLCNFIVAPRVEVPYASGNRNSGSKRLFFFTMYGHGGHLSYVTLTIYIDFRSSLP